MSGHIPALCVPLTLAWYFLFSRLLPSATFKKPFQNGRVNPCIHVRFFGTLEVPKNISFVTTSPRGTRSTVAADALRFYFCISICSRFQLSLRQMIVRYITIPPPHLSITTYYEHYPHFR